MVKPLYWVLLGAWFLSATFRPAQADYVHVGPLSKPDKVLVVKSERKLYLLHDGQVVGSYFVQLGRNPVGPKIFEGDGRTPEGLYILDARNGGSRFYRSIHISYPNNDDHDRARVYGRSAGGLVMIHGQPNEPRSDHDAAEDWTEGCIAVSNDVMNDLWRVIDTGTPIEIIP